MLIVLPSIVSGIGLAFVLAAILVNQQILRDVFLCLGASMLWADFFAPEHFAQFPNLHELFWKATHQAGEAKKSMDPAVGEQLVAYIDEIADIFWQTEKAKAMGVYPPA